MNNAEMHVAAALAAFNPLPHYFEGLDCDLLAARADGAVLVIVSLIDGARDEWRYPDPPVMVPDPDGTESDGSTDEEGNPIAMRTDPLALQVGEYTKRVAFVRAKRAG